MGWLPGGAAGASDAQTRLCDVECLSFSFFQLSKHTHVQVTINYLHMHDSHAQA